MNAGALAKLTFVFQDDGNLLSDTGTESDKGGGVTTENHTEMSDKAGLLSSGKYNPREGGKENRVH